MVLSAPLADLKTAYRRLAAKPKTTKSGAINKTHKSHTEKPCAKPQADSVATPYSNHPDLYRELWESKKKGVFVDIRV